MAYVVLLDLHVGMPTYCKRLHNTNSSHLIKCNWRRAAFIHAANYALMMFEQRQGTKRYTQMHVEASTLAATFNNANYSALLGFVQGNLAEVSSFAHKQAAAVAPGQPPAGFNVDFNFEPPAADTPTFYMTAFSPDLMVSAPLKTALDLV